MYYFLFVFFFNDTATTEIYTLSLHDALPISEIWREAGILSGTLARLQGYKSDQRRRVLNDALLFATARKHRSEEHTSELQSRRDLVCRLLLEKKKKKKKKRKHHNHPNKINNR